MQDHLAGTQVAHFSIPELDETSEAGDLGATLLGISGVSDVTTDLASHSLSVAFDPNYVTAEYLARTLKGAGYPQAGSGDSSTSRGSGA